MKNYLFVYGTLLKHSASKMAEFLAQNATFYSKAYVIGTLYLVDYYPGLVKSTCVSDKVYGHVYVLHDAELVFQVLDEYEEVGSSFPFPNEYLRQQQLVTCENGELVNAWLYIYNYPTENLPQIETGDFVSFIKNT